MVSTFGKLAFLNINAPALHYAKALFMVGLTWAAREDLFTAFS